MKKILFLLLLTTGVANAQIVTIPDANFKAKLLAAATTNQIACSGGSYIKIDANNDGQIQVAEAIVVDSLNVSNPVGNIATSISTMSGIAGFANLKKLNLSGNMVTALDLSALTSLRHLDFSYNQIISFDATPLTNLQVLQCFITPLSNLNLNGLSDLRQLHCDQTPLTALDTSTLINLRILTCNNNQFTTLDLTSCPLLELLVCANGNLTSLNVQGLANLQGLSFTNNQIGSIALDGLSSLIDLSTSDNPLTAVDLSDLGNLKYLDCSNNQLTLLDFTGLLQLKYVDCRNNSLTTLDFSGNPVFDELYANANQLTWVSIKNGFETTSPENGFSENPDLAFICIDESETDLISLLPLENVNFNSYCSFTPGGDFNAIIGNFLFDSDNNGCAVGDIIPGNFRVNINDVITSGSVFTNESGAYAFYTNAGSFTLTPSFENLAWFSISPSSAVVDFPLNDNSVATQNFCLTANGVHPDVEIVISPYIPARAGFDAVYKVVYRNKGNQTLSGTVDFAFDDAVLDLVQSNPSVDTQSIGVLSYNYTNLLPFEDRSILITLHVNGPIDTPPVVSGDALVFTATVNPIASDDLPTDNIHIFNQIVVASHDPNDKLCIEGNLVHPQNIGGYLHYIVNFENIGTASAENVVIKDIIDTTKFDISTLQVINSSHAVETRIRGNQVEFIFKNINLPSSISYPIGGHGNVLFKIKTLPTLSVGDMVTNMANIYFDYNHPIETNEARTTFNTLKRQEFVTDNSVVLYPNPAKNNITVDAKNDIKSIVLFDIQGRLLQVIPGNKNKIIVDISAQSQGIYFVKVTTADGVKIEKIIKD